MDMAKHTVQISTFLKDIVPDFIQNRHNDIHSLSTALQNRDFSTIRNIGHRMKGSSGSYGFKELSEIGSNLESCAEKNNLEDATLEFSKMKKYLEELEIIYVEL